MPIVRRASILPIGYDEDGKPHFAFPGFLAGAADAALLPRDVYQGKVDPNSPEGFERVQNLAGLAMSGGIGGAPAGGTVLGSGPRRLTYQSPVMGGPMRLSEQEAKDLLARRSAQLAEGETHPHFPKDVEALQSFIPRFSEPVGERAAQSPRQSYFRTVDEGDGYLVRAQGTTDPNYRRYKLYGTTEAGNRTPVRSTASMERQPDGRWRTDMLETPEKHQGKGYASALYRAIEKDTGQPRAPSGQLMEDGYKFWQKRDPEAVKYHQPLDGGYQWWSPRRIAETLEDAQYHEPDFVKKLQEAYAKVPPEGKTPEAFAKQFNSGGTPAGGFLTGSSDQKEPQPMLMSRLNPVTGRIEFGKQLGQTPSMMAAPAAPAGNAITMPDGSTMNYTPTATPDNSNLNAFAPLPAANAPNAGAMTMPAPAAPAPAPAPAPVGVGSNANGGMMRQPLGQYYGQLEQERGLPSGFLAKARAIESANGTNLANPNSSARGDFQFIKSTAKQFGLSDPMDPYASARAAADLAKQNMDGIVKRTGQQPDAGDLYVAHQQGLGGYLGLRNGQMPAGQASSLNGGNGQTAGGFLSMWKDKFNNAQVKNLDGFVPQEAGANAGQGPTVANAQAQGLPTGSVAPAADNTYKGGLLGLAGVGDQSAPGMNKGFMDKLGDMAGQPGGGALGGLAKGLGGMVAAMGARPQAAGGITLQANTQAHDPDAQFLAYLDPRRRRAAVGG